MRNESALAHFRDEVIRPQRQIMLEQLEQTYQGWRPELIREFIASFRAWCRQLLELQAAGKKGRIGYLTYSMLRTAMQSGKMTYLGEAQDENWFMDPQPVRCGYEAKWAYLPLEKWKEAVMSRRREYAGQISEMDVEREMRHEAAYVHGYVVALIRQAMPEAVRLEEFLQLDKEAVVEIRVGEYLDHSEVVYKLDERNLDSAEVKEWLEAGKEAEYAYEVYRKLDLADGDYSALDFRYARFEDTRLKDSQLAECMLVGTRFERCMLAGANFSGSFLHEASFEYCGLQGADFRFVEGMSGTAGTEEWDIPGFIGVNFAGADLSEADFTSANLRGARFIGANLTGASFIGANVQGADFTNAVLTDADFTGANLDGALIDESIAGTSTQAARRALLAYFTEAEGEVNLDGA
ncbi:pentapeptide repeat-containing protein [Paenibacillus woosongensis]|uniref:Pentapeptide repeat-containing protein n=1 Tax=Paenibacillus woosongensis TaxID=307580 RepID=A0A7X2Z4D1_9BACL|nr:pentapeptide repeat-containing protein [Paenibacillus woosongensis]MUG47386.1 pentapeptide repeat-containing protein [Paenibacillus woosongensis]